MGYVLLKFAISYIHRRPIWVTNRARELLRWSKVLMNQDVRFWHNRKLRSLCDYRKRSVLPSKGNTHMNNLLTHSDEGIALRIDKSNLNHHLWNNNGTWWVHYTIYPTPVTVERIRRSLKTKILEEARNRRDKILNSLLIQSSQLAA